MALLSAQWVCKMAWFEKPAIRVLIPRAFSTREQSVCLEQMVVSPGPGVLSFRGECCLNQPLWGGSVIAWLLFTTCCHGSCLVTPWPDVDGSFLSHQCTFLRRSRSRSLGEQNDQVQGELDWLFWFFILSLTFIDLCVVWVWLCTGVRCHSVVCMRRSEDNLWLSPSTLWILGLELSFPGLVASTLTYELSH